MHGTNKVFFSHVAKYFPVTGKEIDGSAANELPETSERNCSMGRKGDNN